jgi:hypothetical protein
VPLQCVRVLAVLTSAWFSQEGKLFSKKARRGFQCFAQQQARYLIGEGWKRKAYVTGISDKGYKRLMHHGASCPKYPAPCPANTQTSSAPDKNNLVGGLLWLPIVRLHPHLWRALLAGMPPHAPVCIHARRACPASCLCHGTSWCGFRGGVAHRVYCRTSVPTCPMLALLVAHRRLQCRTEGPIIRSLDQLLECSSKITRRILGVRM